MNEYLAAALIIFVFAIVCYPVNLLIRRAKVPIAVFIVLLYFVAVYFYIEGVNRLHQHLRDKRFYIDFGHDSLLLVLLFFPCVILDVVNCLNAVLHRKQKVIQNKP